MWPGGPQPSDVPAGYHRLEPEQGGPPLTVAVCPPRCPSPPPGRTWGWSSQLYASRSETSWGIGDFADLRRLVGWAGEHGAGFVLINPLHAPATGPVPEPSPYFPSSRCFLNPLYIRIEEVPGAAEVPDVASLAEKARALNRQRTIDRAQVWALKSQALEMLFARAEELAPKGLALRGVSRPTSASGGRSWTVTRRSAPWASVTDCPGRTGRSSTATRRVPRSRSSAPAQDAPASVFTPGCNGCATSSWRRRRRRTGPGSSATWPSGSTAAAPTRGYGRTLSPWACGSAPLLTSSTPRARTGPCRRGTPGNCERPPTSLISRCSGRCCGPPEAFGSTM